MAERTRIAVIMAGGSGERFWPLSRRERPKQLLRLTDPERSMLEEAVERIAPLIAPERVIIATAKHLVEPIRAALAGQLPAENVIGEPCKRNTAGCLAFAAAHALQRFGGDPSKISMAVLTADHSIGQPARFRETVARALDCAEAHGALATIGVTPTRPETGYGYIEVPEGAEPLSGSDSGLPVLPVACFREKPDRPTAEQFVASGRFFWNSGMFFWGLETFLDQLGKSTPAHAEATRAMQSALEATDEAKVCEVFESLEDISIDYALLERADQVIVARADFPWDDVGALDALARNFPADAAGNVSFGDPLMIDTKDCIVYNEPGTEAMAVATVGVEGLAVVVTRDGVLVLPKDRAQDVKQIVTTLKAQGSEKI